MKTYNFRFTEMTNQTLIQKSKLAHMNKSQYLRSCINNSTVLQINTEIQNIEKRKLYLLNNATNNINQIAKHANTFKTIDDKVLSLLEENLKYLKSFIKG